MITKLIIRRERPEIYTHLEKFLEENLTTKTGESCNLHEARWLHGFGYSVCGVPFTCNLPEFSSTCSLKPSEGDPSESLLQRKENRFNGRDLVNMLAD